MNKTSSYIEDIEAAISITKPIFWNAFLGLGLVLVAYFATESFFLVTASLFGVNCFLIHANEKHRKEMVKNARDMDNTLKMMVEQSKEIDLKLEAFRREKKERQLGDKINALKNEGDFFKCRM